MPDDLHLTSCESIPVKPLSVTRPRWLISVLLMFAAFVMTGCGGGNGKVEVPELEGLGYAKALSTLDDAGLEMDVKGQWSDNPADHVMSQTPAALVGVPEGTTVTVVISLGPQPKAATPVPKPAPPRLRIPRPPHLRRSAYDRAVAALDRKCNEGPDLINRYVAKTVELLSGRGINESPTSIVKNVNYSYSKGLPVTDCDQLFAAYVTLRQHG